MDAMQWQLQVCDVTVPGVVLAIWVGVIGLSIVIGRLLRWLPIRLTRAVVVTVLMVGGLLGGPASAFATSPPTPEGCYWLQASGMPCWMLQALWCPCGDDPPPPPPPPQG